MCHKSWWPLWNFHWWKSQLKQINLYVYECKLCFCFCSDWLMLHCLTQSPKILKFLFQCILTTLKFYIFCMGVWAGQVFCLCNTGITGDILASPPLCWNNTPLSHTCNGKFMKVCVKILRNRSTKVHCNGNKKHECGWKPKYV